MVVEADHEQIEVARGARDRGDLLLLAVEHGLAGQREPVRVPAAVWSFQKVVQTWLSKPMTNRSRLPGARDTAATCCLSWSKTAWPGSGNQSAFQPVWSFQKVVQTWLSKPMTNRSRLPGARETAATCCLLVVEDGLARQREPVRVPAGSGRSSRWSRRGCRSRSRTGPGCPVRATPRRPAASSRSNTAWPGSGNQSPIPAGLVVPEGGPDVVVETDDEQVEVARGARDRGDLLLLVVEDGLAGSGNQSAFQPVWSFQKVVQTWLSKPITNRSRLPGARETAATCCFSWSKTAWPGSGNKSRFQPVWSFQKVVQTRLSKPITNRSRLPGARETAATAASRGRTRPAGSGKKSGFQEGIEGVLEGGVGM